MKREEISNRVQKAQVIFFKGRLVSFAFAFLLCFTFTSTYAFLYAAGGGRPGAVFDFGAGARPLGMGGTYSAIARDASAVYYNPAGLGLMSGRNLSLMHAALYEGASYDYFSYAQNFARLTGAWGGQLLQLNVRGIEGRDEFNVRTSNISYTETAFAVGGGLSGILYPGLSAGFSAKILNRSLAGESDNLLGFDAGLQYGPFYGDRLNLSFVAQNLGAFATGDTSDRLPFTVKAGASYLLAGSIILAADISSDRMLRVGTEYVMGPAALRVGYGGGDISFGAGVKFLKSYSFDLAMAKNPDFGVSSRFSLGYLFGGVAQLPRAKTYATDYLALAEANFKDALWLKAYNSIAMAIGMDAGLKKNQWGERFLRLGELIKGLKLREMPEREANFSGFSPAAAEAAIAAREYIEGQTVKSILLAHSASGYEPDDVFYSEALRVFSTLNSREVIKDEILPRPMLINLKLEKAAAAFYVQDFEKVVKECSEALLIDEGNADAWKKLGSAYSALGDTAGAKRAYGKVPVVLSMPSAVALAEAELNDASWLKAYDSIAMVVGMDAGLKKNRWGERFLRLGELIKGLKLGEMPEREANFKGSALAAAEEARAAREYIEGQTVKSILLAHSASGYEPNNAFYSEALRVFSTLNSREVIKDEILPRPMLIKSKLEKAAAAFYVRNFEKVVKECSEVLLIDEGNADAWKKLGSAYFALGDAAGAKRAYGKALELNPQDGSVMKFMVLQGWR